MITYIKGKIAELQPARLVMECGGMGYEIQISLTTYADCRDKAECMIHIHEVIREDAHLLFGFSTTAERELFLLLTSVSGVGPNTARMILSSMPPADLTAVIAAGDEKALTLVKGIGSKTAQRILIDLKNKVKPAESKVATAGGSRDGASMAGEAVSALVMLGFVRAASQKAVDAILKQQPGLPVEQIIKTALKML